MIRRDAPPLRDSRYKNRKKYFAQRLASLKQLLINFIAKMSFSPLNPIYPIWEFSMKLYTYVSLSENKNEISHCLAILKHGLQNSSFCTTIVLFTKRLKPFSSLQKNRVDNEIRSKYELK